ncbi:MAG: PadR family transcriptional regulator [Candidatus Micrarchaeota archaeon]
MKSNENPAKKSKPLARLVDSLTYSNLWLSILSLAAKNRVYAYSLPEKIDQEFGFTPSRLMIYLVLYKLEGEGLLRSSEEGQRRYYSISASGRRCLQEGKRLLRKRADEI